MKSLNKYIVEKLKLGGNNKLQRYNYHPKDRKELRKIIEQLLKERGPDAYLNDIDISEITNMSNLFWGFNHIIRHIDISEWNVSNVEDMTAMFVDCYNFNSDLSRWDVSKVKFMEQMFYGCKKFDSDLSKWDVSNVKNMTAMFRHCENFKGIGLDKWKKPSKLKYKTYMLSYCDSLINKPKWYK